MKPSAIVLFFLLGFSACSYGQARTVQVLFIGNSFTNAHNMPGMVSNLVTAAGLKADISFHYAFGQSINYFIKDASCWQAIKSKTWDYIVFQDNQRFYYDSLGKFDSMGYASPVLANNLKLQDSIKKLIPCVKIIYFAGWELEGGLPDRFPGDNTEKMLKRILANYSYLNHLPGVNNTIAPIGVGWISSIFHEPYLSAKPYDKFDLYDVDGRHPGWTGSYLGACVMFAVIFHQSPVGLKNKYILEGTTIDNFTKMMAWQAVQDSFAYTNLAAITPSLTLDSNIVSTSKEYKSYQWYSDNKPIAGATKYQYTMADKACNYWVETIDQKGCFGTSFPVNPSSVKPKPLPNTKKPGE